MSTPLPPSPVRAPLIARLWTWMASIALAVVAVPVAISGVLTLLRWDERPVRPWPADAPPALVNEPILRSHPVLAIGIVVWLTAWALHLYPSRRRRMSLAHAIVPAAIFGIFLILALFIPPLAPLP